MSDSRHWLLRCYPRAWRARYGEEMQELIVEASGRRLPWRMQLDIALAGSRERLRSSGLTGDSVPPVERTRAGTLLVLCAWVAFVVAGLGVQKTSEHWQSVTPASRQGLPAAAFDALLGAAAIGSALVLIGIGCVVPSLVVFLRQGGWGAIRGAVMRAAVVSALGVVATAAVAYWAKRHSNVQRIDHPVVYLLGFATWGLLMLACLIAWTVAGVAVARRIDLSARVLKVEALLAAAVCTTMVAMTVATVVWWAAVAGAAPWFFADRPVGAPASATVPQLILAVILMLTATAMGTAGALRALRALTTAGRQAPA